MLPILARTALLSFALGNFCLSQALDWKLSTNVTGEGFLQLFRYSKGNQTAPSTSAWTTEGDARSSGLVSVSEDSVVNIKVDVTSKFPNGLRPTVRLESQNLYGDGVFM